MTRIELARLVRVRGSVSSRMRPRTISSVGCPEGCARIHCVRAVAQTSIRIAATATSAGRETTPNMSAIAAAEDRQASASLRSVVPR
jgi:hypothetical protein